VHEFSITESILNLALEKAREAQASRITKISLVVGELSGVVPDSVQFYFGMIRQNTIAEQAQLSFETRPTQVRCRKCGHVYSPNGQDWACPECYETGIDIISGRECFMESIEVE
jgi:hydrogenase nickel incorporation protein HypA/HybF